MTLLYERQPGSGDLLYLLRLAFGSAMATCLILSFTASRHGNVAGHRAWMIRACAIGLAAGTRPSPKASAAPCSALEGAR